MVGYSHFVNSVLVENVQLLYQKTYMAFKIDTSWIWTKKLVTYLSIPFLFILSVRSKERCLYHQLFTDDFLRLLGSCFAEMLIYSVATSEIFCYESFAWSTKNHVCLDFCWAGPDFMTKVEMFSWSKILFTLSNVKMFVFIVLSCTSVVLLFLKE